ncbi:MULTISPECIES: NAD(P)H-quinone oxidoreductase [unclassified Polynucleobacter]|uniref:NAD(P)H-quinone oxidoreductase n=1 Tax=unclassified Polynucleobacter TaxID=2640945 RepID=UPI00257422B9|nr:MULTISPECIES: NAD(P)H-quinone oxidoreductase [unclassified Polynucleobacter]BEI35681.1 NAD(P)H-quinone oxidoreductase [Polynucleobacter sp. HIN6]BEI41252.1 NAD(P)H-quinone oxidoreductase [Polynucleobacter sp. HIN9]BEI43024.1 NAD(P)H-quinone oxidoreductase [Polynucleobacter sp. HIN10]BEI44801.1 NAD(P)H-quinone oxidoreductase [Polynucleobacter sp. HIN11]
MRVMEIREYGAPEMLVKAERPDPAVPSVGSGEVLIRVKAAGINRPDVLQRKGHYPVPPGASDIPGLEVAGEIIGGDLAHADNTFGLKVGDKVCALVQGGGYADLCTAPIAQCLPYPKGFSDIEAASLPETFFTVWSNVFQRGHLSKGETLLVQGGSSGIGVTAILIAKALGHRVFVTAGSDEKCAACTQLGADLAINYKTQDFVEEIKKATNGKGVDVILDMVTGTYLQREIDCLADDGRIVIIAIMGGSKAEVNTGQILRRRLTITGSTLRPRPVAFKHQITKELYQTVWPLLNAGQLKPVIYKTFSLEQAADAHRLMESSEHVGKIVLTV